MKSKGHSLPFNPSQSNFKYFFPLTIDFVQLSDQLFSNSRSYRTNKVIGGLPNKADTWEIRLNTAGTLVGHNMEVSIISDKFARIDAENRTIILEN